MKAVLICGPWGSGTTAVAGLAARLGAVGFDPAFHFRTDDPRTPDSYELMPFRNLVRQHVDEPTLSRKLSAPGVVQASLGLLRHRIAMQEYGQCDSDAPVILKYPLSVLFVQELAEAFELRLVYVMRAAEQIEQTRARRNWPAYFGAAGATVIYRHMADIEHTGRFSIETVHFAELVAAPMEHAGRLSQFFGLAPTPAQFRSATEYVMPRG